MRKIDKGGELFILGLLIEGIHPCIFAKSAKKIDGTFAVHDTPSTVCRIIQRNGFTKNYSSLEHIPYSALISWNLNFADSLLQRFR